MKKFISTRWALCLVYGIILTMLASTVTLSSNTTTGNAGQTDKEVIGVCREGICQTLEVDVSELLPGETKTVYFDIVNYEEGRARCCAAEYTVKLESDSECFNVSLKGCGTDNAQGKSISSLGCICTDWIPLLTRVPTSPGCFTRLLKASHTYALKIERGEAVNTLTDTPGTIVLSISTAGQA